mgnify:CR=1 FL=1
MPAEELKRHIRDIPDFPVPGVLFRDLTPLLKSPEAFRLALGLLEAQAKEHRPTLVAGIEARGFVFAAPVAARLGVGLVPVRKPGKLPWRTIEEDYALEYGSGRLQIHADAATAGDRVLLIDDLLATGGTAAAAARLIERTGATVTGMLFLVEPTQRGGRRLLLNRTVQSLVSF